MKPNARLRKLQQRIRCGFVWPAKDKQPDHLTHTCEVFVGHYLGPHRCGCGGGTPVRAARVQQAEAR